MADAGARTSDDVDPAVAAHEREVQRNREQLARTVDELHHKLDVKAQAQGRVRDAKARMTSPDGRPKPAFVAAAVGLVAVAALVVWQRRR